VTQEQLAPGAGLEVNQAAEVDRVAGAGGARATVTRLTANARLAAGEAGDDYGQAVAAAAVSPGPQQHVAEGLVRRAVFAKGLPQEAFLA
jgi:hypothetical protein